jgi:hypothetical protein
MNRVKLLTGFLFICIISVLTGCQAEPVTTTVHSTTTTTTTPPAQTVTVTDIVTSTVTDTITITPSVITTADTSTVTSSSAAGISTEVAWFEDGDDWFYAFSYKTEVPSPGITLSGGLGYKGLSKVAILSVNADLYDINGNIIGTTDTLDISHNVESATPKFALTYETSDTSVINRVVINVHCDYA